MENLTEFINFDSKSIISVIGCGGKTSLINSLAHNFYDKKVLITTTTKIFPPENVKLITDFKEMVNIIPENSIYCFGFKDISTGKLHGLSTSELDQITDKFDVILIEADGSKSLPFKGYHETEPVIFDKTTHTFCVISVNDIGKNVSSDLILRLDEFITQTDAKIGEKISDTHVIKMLEMMSRDVKSCKFLFINNPTIKENQIFDLCKKVNKYLEFEEIFYGFAQKNEWKLYNE